MQTSPRTFAQWMDAVDRVLESRIGFSSGDLEDWMWRDSFEAGDSPRDAALSFLEDMGYVDDEEDDYDE